MSEITALIVEREKKLNSLKVEWTGRIGKGNRSPIPSSTPSS